jgi:hypothetical protein
MNNPWNDPEREQPARDDLELEALARLYREHAPVEPSAVDWDRTWQRIEARLPGIQPRRRWGWSFLAGIVATAAAVFGGILLARVLWSTTPGELPPVVQQRTPAVEDDEPYPVALASEVNIIRIDPNDADRIVMGQPLMGDIEFATPEEIDFDIDSEEGQLLRVRRIAGGPMIIVARADDDEDP